VSFIVARSFFNTGAPAAKRVAADRVVVPPYRHPGVKATAGGANFRKALEQYMVPECTSPLVWFRTPDAVVIYDGFPKAAFHALVIPFGMPRSVRELTLEHWPRLQGAHALARQIAARLAADVQIGYHARPSLDHLHIHVISTDLSGCKTAKHFNSFSNPALFVRIQAVENDLTAGRRVQLKDPDELEALETQPRGL